MWGVGVGAWQNWLVLRFGWGCAGQLAAPQAIAAGHALTLLRAGVLDHADAALDGDAPQHWRHARHALHSQAADGGGGRRPARLAHQQAAEVGLPGLVLARGAATAAAGASTACCLADGR